MTSTKHTEGQKATIERVERGLTSGEFFRLKARSDRSVPLGGPPISARGYSGIMVALARFAGDSDWAASVVNRIIGRINLYLTPNEVLAQVAEGLSMAVADGYFDVVGATGPEASRLSAHQHPTTLRQALILAALMTEVEMSAGYIGHVPNIGWVVDHLLDRERVTLYPNLFPKVAAKRAERAAAATA